MHHELMNLVDYIDDLIRRVPGLTSVRWPQLVRYFSRVWKSSARNIPWFSKKCIVTTVKLVKVGIVDPTPFDLERDPIKRHMTRGAPHLRAPANLEDHLTTPGTRFGVLFQKPDRFDVVGIAYVTVTIGDLVALFANVVFANLTLPSRGKKPATL